MNDNPLHPYSLDIIERPPGSFHWAIRERGKLLQRSDKPASSKRAARERGAKAIEGLSDKTGREERY